MQIVYHLDVLQRGFQSGLFDKNLMENVYKIHFVVNIDNGLTLLGFGGDTIIKYAEVFFGKNSMTMVIRISRGQQSMIKIAMIIFTNVNSNYPICSLEDNIPSVSYRIGPKGWMDQALFPKKFAEHRSFQANMHGCTKVIWIDNCTIHDIKPTLINIFIAKQPILQYLPPSSTHL